MGEHMGLLADIRRTSVALKGGRRRAAHQAGFTLSYHRGEDLPLVICMNLREGKSS